MSSAEGARLMGRSSAHCRRSITATGNQWEGSWATAVGDGYGGEPARNDQQWDQAAQPRPEVEFDKRVAR